MKTKFRIATQAYEFIEIEGDESDIPKMLELQRKYSDNPMQEGTTKRVKDIFGNEIDYDEVNHIYSWNGEKYMSGSEYAAQFEKPFDKDKIAENMAKKWEVKAQDIKDMWELKADVSKGFGTAIHAALELYGKYGTLAKSMEKDTHLHDHPIISKAVSEFYAKNKEKSRYEVFVIDHKNKRAGQIDRLVQIDGKLRVDDYKTNAKLPKEKIEVYFKQLQFYTEILEANGQKTLPPVIHHWNGEWKRIEDE